MLVLTSCVAGHGPLFGAVSGLFVVAVPRWGCRVAPGALAWLRRAVGFLVTVLLVLKAVPVAIRGSRYCIQISHKIDLDSVGRARNLEKHLKGFATAAHSPPQQASC